MYQWLAEAAGNHSTILTASRRLARLLSSEYGRQQLALGNKAWRSPGISPLDDWLTSTVNTAEHALPVVLNSHASAIIWERCLKAESREQVLNIRGLVRQARQSWQRLHEWRVPLSEVSASARSQDEQLFAVTAHKYRAILAENDWIDDAQVAGVVSALIEEQKVPVPERITYAGFDRLVPAVEHLFALVASRGGIVAAAEANEARTEISHSVFDNAEAELRAAGVWARHELTENPAAVIGVVSSSLEKDGVASERLIREGVAPGWQFGGADLHTAVNTSYGRRLSDYPAISIALLLLQWAHRDLSFDDISLLLRTPCIAGRDTAGRCKLEIYLRRLPDQPWTPASIIRLFKRRASDADAVKWLEGIELLSSFRSDAAGKASPAAWADKIDGLLRQLVWPGSGPLASDEFQLINRWRELLNDLARLEIVCPNMIFAEASGRLASLATAPIYQPQTQDGVVQLLGPLEAAGMSFDGIWIAGLDADSWPPPAHPLSLVSRQLQREYAMPDSGPDDTLEYSRRVLNRLMGSARSVRLSWPHTSEETENSVSPLIAGYDTIEQGQTTDPGWHALELIGTNRLEKPENDEVPAIQQDELVAGGAHTVQRQATDPFSAFAYGRLRVSELDSVGKGLSPAQRGSLIHKALHDLFAEKPSQSEIARWSELDRHERVRSAVGSALKEYLWHADPVLHRLLALEHDRLCDLLGTFVEEELRRAAFRIDRVEHEIEYRQSGVRLNLRIDRIDRLPDQSLLIADYKTGQPKTLLNSAGDPHDLQLVVYACALEEIIGGLVLINIDSRSIQYRGTGGSVEWDAKHADQWPERLTAWKEKVARAMRQISQGDARLNLDLPSERMRPLNVLSRFEERRRDQR
jgi:probable DNA repair protein